MSNNFKLMVFIFIASTLAACAGMSPATTPNATIAELTPYSEPVQRQMVADDPAARASLFQEISSRNMFQDMRAAQVGDLVTINIVETAKANKSASTQTGRESSIDAGIDNLLGWENKIKNLTSFGRDDVKDGYNKSSMFSGSLSNNFNGSGSTSRNESMTASVTAVVTEVKPNGNLFIKGTRQVKVNNETQYIILSGQIRPEDISPDNTVLSSYIGDARIEYMGSGPVSDKQRAGWLSRGVDFIWPF
jgi:flagellar L-ring protein precursor FlgH